MDPSQGQPARPVRRCVDGVVLVDKPVGLTSNAVLQRVRRAYRAQKAGHTGTLDPLASGLLPICLGEATKFSLGLLDADKAYRAILRMGVTTETGDVEGAVLLTRPVELDRERIEHALAGFRGEIMQVPHKYSAIKRDGRALYSYARAGETVVVEPRRVCIHSLAIEQWDSPLLSIDVLCSKGTYIRSLAEDIGEVLGCGAHLQALRRVRVGRFGIERAASLESIESRSEVERDAMLLPVASLVEAFPVVVLVPALAGKFQHGQRVGIDPRPDQPDVLVAVHAQGTAPGCAGRFLGVARAAMEDEQWVLVPARLMTAATSAGE